MSSSTKSSSQYIPRAKSPSPKYTLNDGSVAEVKHGESPSSFIKNDESRLETSSERVDPSRRQSMKPRLGASGLPEVLEHPPLKVSQQVFEHAPSKVSENTDREKEQVRGELPSGIRVMSHASEGAQVYQVPEDTDTDAERHTGLSRMPQVLETAPCEGEMVCDNPPRLSAASKPSDATQESILPAQADVTSQAGLQTAELNKRCDTLLKEREILWGKLKEQESLVTTLKADNHELQRWYEGQSSKLASTRDRLRSCQSQLDNVQRFISTADKHADQEIIQMLQGLNEEVYGMSMTMADYVTEGHGFARHSATNYRTRGPILINEENLARTIGPTLIRQLTAAGNEEVALYLQIAFQGFLSHLLCRVVSFWTTDPEFNAFIEETYQRLRKSETQAIFGRWRSLTRTYVLPTPASSPNIPLKDAMTGLTDIVTAAGFVSTTYHDVTYKLSSKYKEKILSIMSHAGRLADMVSGMISGDFDVFVVQPGAAFDGGKMKAIDDNITVTRETGAAHETVLCVSRVGLRKHVGEKTIILTEAEVVLRSFLAKRDHY